MRVKSFHGKSIKEALEKARRELGTEATIVASRQLRPEEGSGCEVVCGINEPERPAAPVAAPAAAPAERTVSRGVTRIRKSIEALVKPTEDQFGSAAVRAELVAAGFASDLADDIVAGVRQRQRQGTGVEQALQEELGSRISLAPQLGAPRAECRIVAFVGPPGAGKTTSLVKLAVRYGLQGRKGLHIISMDSWRVGGADALRSFASGMGVTFNTCETAASLSQCLEENAGKGLILIDTPGMGPNDIKLHLQLASVLATHPGAEVQLVLPATLSSASLASAVKRFQPFLPSKILITCGDCAESFLPVAAVALSHEKPVSFISTGQVIPEDMEEATVTRLFGSTVAGTARKAATSAA